MNAREGSAPGSAAEDGVDAAGRLREIAEKPIGVVGFGRAGDLVSAVGKRAYLHAGPPIRPSATIGAMRGALIGALLLEGEAESPEAADTIVANDDLEIRPCHDVFGAGALAGVVSPKVPVVVVERAGGCQAFSTVVEGLGKALSFGNFDDDTLRRVDWLATEFSEVLNEALALIPPIDVVALQAKSLRRGDECHNRLVAATEQLIVMLAPAFVQIGERSRPVLGDLIRNPHFFLTLSVAAAKAVASTIEMEGPAGILTACAGNGVATGIRVSGAPEAWYVGEAVAPANLMLVPGMTVDDAAPLMGDSGTTEVVGLGAFCLTAAPALARALGVDVAGAAKVVAEMRRICVTEHPRFLLPADDFTGSPFGVSVEAVVRTGITPYMNAGYAHKTPGMGRVGADVASYPREAFDIAFADISTEGAPSLR